MRTLRGSMLLAAPALLALSGTPAYAVHDVLDPIFDANVSGGDFGWRVKRLGGSLISSLNSSFAFYPASSIKVLHHLEVMRLVEIGLLDLDATQVPVCTASTNCTDDPNLSVGSCVAQQQNLDDVLVNMMRISGNRTTNAVQELIGATLSADPQPASSGRQVLNNLAQDTIGTSDDMRVLHKFACDNVDNAPNENHATLADYSLLYEAIGSRPEILAPETRVALKDLMLDEDNSFMTDQLATVIDEEADDLGKAAIADQFESLVRLIYKPGSVTNDGKRYVSFAGLVQLPINNGAGKRLYTFSTFVEGADSVVDGTERLVSAELLRGAIRSALLSWSTVPGPGSVVSGLGSAKRSLERIARLARDGSTRRAIQRAINDLREASRHLKKGRDPLGDRAADLLLDAQQSLEGVSLPRGDRALAAVRADLADLAGRLSDDAGATLMGESLHPLVERLSDLAAELDARGEAARGPLAATSWFRDAVHLAALALRSPFQDECPVYALGGGCPEDAPGTGLAESDGRAGEEGSGEELEEAR